MLENLNTKDNGKTLDHGKYLFDPCKYKFFIHKKD